MSELKIKGTIKRITPIEEAGAGKKLSFRIDTGEQYNNIVEFEMYKGPDYIEHLDNFVKYNKIDDLVEVEFNLKTYNWKPEAEDRIFTNLSAWRVDKVDSETPPQSQPSVMPEAAESVDKLPF